MFKFFPKYCLRWVENMKRSMRESILDFFVVPQNPYLYVMVNRQSGVGQIRFSKNKLVTHNDITRISVLMGVLLYIGGPREKGFPKTKWSRRHGPTFSATSQWRTFRYSKHEAYFGLSCGTLDSKHTLVSLPWKRGNSRKRKKNKKKKTCNCTSQILWSVF